MISKSNFKIKVEATAAFKLLDKKPIELDHVPEQGEIFEVSISRYYILSGNNKYNKVFVKKKSGPKLPKFTQVIEEIPVDEFVLTPSVEVKQPKKRCRKKKE